MVERINHGRERVGERIKERSKKMSATQRANYIEEAKKLLDIIKKGTITKKEDFLFVESMKSRVKFDGFVTRNQIFWLRDIKDRQLED